MPLKTIRVSWPSSADFAPCGRNPKIDTLPSPLGRGWTAAGVPLSGTGSGWVRDTAVEERFETLGTFWGKARLLRNLPASFRSRIIAAERRKWLLTFPAWSPM